jgi:hypothetical protein
MYRGLGELGLSSHVPKAYIAATFEYPWSGIRRFCVVTPSVFSILRNPNNHSLIPLYVQRHRYARCLLIPSLLITQHE